MTTHLDDSCGWVGSKQRQERLQLDSHLGFLDFPCGVKLQS